MTDDGAAGRAPAHIRDVLFPGRWALWQQRRGLVGYCLLAEAAAVVLTVRAAVTTVPTARDLVVLATLAGMGILQAELGRQVERVRRRVNTTPHINMTSVWTFAGVLLLPAALVAALVAVLYLHLAVRSWYRLRRVPPFRTVFNASLVTLTCHAASAVLVLAGVPAMGAVLDAGWRGVVAVVLAGVVYFAVGALVALPGLTVEKRTVQALFGGWADNALEASTLCLGVLTALALATLPALAVLVVPPLLFLHRGVLVKQLEVAATTDEKTGLFNTAGWHNLATRELARVERTPDACFGVLMIDLDHFKRINDTHGHLAGDAVLKAVATAITDSVRDYDSVGRFGGEEFVVLLPDVTRTDVITVAERVRASIEVLTVATTATVIDDLSASIGVAMYPDAGAAVERLLQAADEALYQAKSLGRNRVVSLT
ncbi:diguanylate cyclase (GGDEF) domain-containing protein [Amycolatopsis xylanica]|uniref:Diguanylate cyclase (GGDEF) domain-containing protein n=1 Tax=Amycolatopsis xylanica TaxID=589385 RepID=A0A1H3GSR0_9PSEU|nr:GGDEF domain-containing protein [Amycolatopsis xylanica]SDY05688.1 diguanylate cyclase (GGDEF) domain-containing protein [Amycolatopsis xylanica]